MQPRTVLPTALGELDTIVGPDGSTAQVARHGGHVVSWQTADGVERLFVSSRATAGEGVAIRGGIPVCFPQFAALGPQPKHGFARSATWTRRGPSTFALDIAHGTWPGWPHAVQLELDVLLGPSALTVVLRVSNRDDHPFEFTAALHTYLSCADVTAVAVRGLDGREVHGGGRITGEITFGNGTTDVDLAVLAAQGAVEVSGTSSPDDTVVLVAETGFPDVVVWNIGSTLGASMGDLGSGQWRGYVCVEAAVVGSPVVVEAGRSWSGSQTLLVR
jgi:glucose-6-phosphate 1-epimerase